MARFLDDLQTGGMSGQFSGMSGKTYEQVIQSAAQITMAKILLFIADTHYKHYM